MGNINENTARPVRTVALMMIATVASKALGMLRSVFLGAHYNAGAETNAFSAAAHIPLTFFDLLFGAAILGCFIPVYNSLGRKSDGSFSREADDFAVAFLNLILLATGLLAIVGILCAPVLISLVASGLSSEEQALGVKLLRIMFPMIIFTGSAYTLTGVMQSRGKYLLPACISAFSNAAIVIYFIFIDKNLGDRGIYGLAVAYLVAWSLQLITLALPLARSGFRWRAVLSLRSPSIRRALKMAPPIMIGSWLTPIGTLVAIKFSSYVAVPGNVTVYDYAYTIYAIIAGTLTYSICNYTFPELSRLASGGDEGAFAQKVRVGLGASAALLLPFLAATVILAGEGVAAMYFWGEFTEQSAMNVSGVLRLLTVGMPAFAVVEIGSRVFYAKGLVRLPMFAALCGIAVNIASAALLTRIPSLGVSAVGLANAVGMTAAAVLMLIFMFIYVKRVFDRQFVVRLLKTAAAAVAAALLMLVIWRFTSSLWGGIYAGGLKGFVRNIAVCCAVFVPGGALYLVLLKILKIKMKEER